MKLKIFKYVKRKEQLKDFESSINSFLSSVGEVLELNAWENVHSTDVYVSLLHKETGSPSKVNVITWGDTEFLQDVINDKIDSEEKSNNLCYNVKVVTASGSSRSLAIFLSKGNNQIESSKPEENDKDQNSTAPRKNNRRKAKDI